MTNLIQLQEKVQGMLDGEKKRRETAYKLIDQLQEILIPVAEDIWGTGEADEVDHMIWVRNKNKEGQNKATDFYFRYVIHETQTRDEYPGFYSADFNYPIWGVELKELKGSNFWNGMRCVINWIPVLLETIKKRNESREQLLKLVNF